ncbi:MAG: VWA domain-containing protein, partial [Thermoflexales bacterium]|nr:VWA domain-containing protein [Thermoflexales bacterium]
MTHRLVIGRAIAAGLLAVSAALGAASAQASLPNGATISSIAISGVDTAGFPRVVSYVSILSDGGLPASGVSGADLKVLEDGIEVPAADVEAQGDTSQPIGISFAIDTATSPDELNAIKAVVRAMINGFSARDQGAIIGFGGTAQVAQAATGNAQALLSALDGLKAGGTFTAMNDGAQAAAREAAAFTASSARRAVAL